MTNAGVHEKGTFNAQNVIDNIKKTPNYHKAGAIGLFIGVVRGETLEPEKEKVEKADFVIKNNSAKSELRKKTEFVYTLLNTI